MIFWLIAPPIMKIPQCRGKGGPRASDAATLRRCGRRATLRRCDAAEGGWRCDAATLRKEGDAATLQVQGDAVTLRRCDAPVAVRRCDAAGEGRRCDAAGAGRRCDADYSWSGGRIYTPCAPGSLLRLLLYLTVCVFNRTALSLQKNYVL